ncbi:MAG: Holliday junction resolvase RuvX [Nocardioides sp.]
MRHGTRLGIDPGDARIGVARSDPSGFLATPVETVRRGKGDLARLRRIVAELVEETTVLEVVVGLPRSLGGGEGPAAAKVREFAAQLAERVRALKVNAGTAPDAEMGPLITAEHRAKADLQVHRVR